MSPGYMRPRSIVPVCWSAVVIVGAALPAHAAGGDLPWPSAIVLVAMFLALPALAGLALSNVSLVGITFAGAILWIMAWFLVVFEKGFNGAVERTGPFILMMIFFSLPVLVGWTAGRFRRRARTRYPAVTHGN